MGPPSSAMRARMFSAMRGMTPGVGECTNERRPSSNESRPCPKISPRSVSYWYTSWSPRLHPKAPPMPAYPSTTFALRSAAVTGGSVALRIQPSSVNMMVGAALMQFLLAAVARHDERLSQTARPGVALAPYRVRGRLFDKLGPSGLSPPCSGPGTGSTFLRSSLALVPVSWGAHRWV